MLSTIGRSAIRRIGGGASISTNRALQSLWQLHRAEYISATANTTAQPLSWLKIARTYATATKAAAKPKTTKAKSTTKSTTKPKAKKAAKKKPVKKKKAAPKKAVKKPKVTLTEEQKARAEIKQLKVKALVAEEPAGLPNSTWVVFLTREIRNNASKGSATERSSSAAAQYRNLSPSELAELNHEANENRARNAITHKQWVESHSPIVINEANNARRALRRRLQTTKYQLIQDSRLPKRPSSPYLLYSQERRASGDLKGVGTLSETAKILGDEWNALSGAEKKKYEDAAAADKLRYIQEYKTVFKKDSSAKV